MRWLTLLGTAVAIGMATLGGWILLDSRDDAWRRAERSADNLTLTLERDIERLVETYDISLQQAMTSFNQPGVESLSPHFRQMLVFDRSTAADYCGVMLILGPDGQVLLESTADQPTTMNLADRDYFWIHRDTPHTGLFVSHAFRSRSRGGEPTFAISRRIDGPDGTFAGVAMGSLRLAYFQTLFARLQLGTNGTVSLLLDDGHLLARMPWRDTDLDRNLSGSFGFLQTLAQSGHYVTKALDGITRLYSYHRVGDLPLVINVGISVDDIYAVWWRKAAPVGGILAVLCCATLSLCMLFRVEMTRRVRAEAALVGRAEALEVMATTDGLTGLSNRRAFEGEMARAWRHAIRQQEPVSMLMIDADCFKLFNDRYGHPAGDRVLRSLAGSIDQTIRRPRDIAARYGGEEFVVLLPETGEAGAADVAERIRQAIAALTISHADSPSGHVTVSVGVATAWPVVDDRDAWLLKQADLALYEAKHGGRNRVCIATPARPFSARPAPALAVDPA